MNPQRLVEAIAALKRQHRSINNLAKASGVSRESVTAMSEGRRCRLDVVEKFARGLGLDLNEWRELNGYPSVAPESSSPLPGAGRRQLDHALPPATPLTTRQLEEVLAADRAIVRRQLLPLAHFVIRLHQMVEDIDQSVTLTADDFPYEGMAFEEVETLLRRLRRRMQDERDRRRGTKAGEAGSADDNGTPLDPMPAIAALAAIATAAGGAIA